LTCYSQENLKVPDRVCCGAVKVVAEVVVHLGQPSLGYIIVKEENVDEMLSSCVKGALCEILRRKIPVNCQTY
jgi:hypothetical protein